MQPSAVPQKPRRPKNILTITDPKDNTVVNQEEIAASKSSQESKSSASVEVKSPTTPVVSPLGESPDKSRINDKEPVMNPMKNDTDQGQSPPTRFIESQNGSSNGKSLF